MQYIKVSGIVAAVAQFQSLAQEMPCAMGAAIKKKIFFLSRHEQKVGNSRKLSTVAEHLKPGW